MIKLGKYSAMIAHYYGIPMRLLRRKKVKKLFSEMPYGQTNPCFLFDIHISF